MILLIEKLRTKSLLIAAAIYATPMWILLFLGLSLHGLRWLVLLDVPGIAIVSFLAVFMSATVGPDWLYEAIEPWQTLTASCVFYYLLILLILYIVRRVKRRSLARRSESPS